jgi:hypothetical protein
MASMARFLTLVACLGLAGCLAPPNECRGDPGGDTPTADEVCDHLAAIGCLAGPIPEFIDAGGDGGLVEVPFDAAGEDLRSVHARECRAGYASFRQTVDPERFGRLSRCYRASRSCAEVEACNRGCAFAGEDAGGDASSEFDAAGAASDAAADGGGEDGSSSDAGVDGGAPDASVSPVDAAADASTG